MIHMTITLFGHFQLELQACSDNTSHGSNGYKDDGMKESERTTLNKKSLI